MAMKDMKDLLGNERRMKELAKHPYFKLLDIVYNRINSERVREGYKPRPYGYFAKQLAIFPSHHEKWAFLKECQQKSNFGRFFFGIIKKKKADAKLAKQLQSGNKDTV
jgi:hypothetical protein